LCITTNLAANVSVEYLRRKSDFYVKQQHMAKIVKQKKRGRPGTGHTPFVGVRLPPPLIALVEKWASKHNGGLSRSEAIRRLIEIGLAKPKATKPRE